MLDLDEIIHKAQELQPLPASAVRLASLLSSADSDLSEITDVVAYDEALAMRLIRAANSASTGGSARVTRPQDAVLRLGFARVLSLSVASSVNSLMKKGVQAYGLNEGSLWEHSIATAATAEVLPEFTTEELPLETFTAALLHDVGKLVMGRYLSKEDLEWIQRAQQEGGVSALEAERQVLNVHHGELGGIIAQHWDLPERIVKGIIYHHNPEDGVDPVCDAVYVSNILAKAITNQPVGYPNDDSLQRLGLQPIHMEALLGSARARFTVVKARYNA